MNKYLFIFTLILTKIGLSIPYLSYALPGTGLFDYSKKMFMAIDDKFGFYVAVLGSILIIYAIIAVLLLIVSSLLDWVIVNQMSWISFDEPLVSIGYAFTSGLANMLLILILLVIAFAIILKIENFEIKKVLPRLIIVALLLNFSLVFMGVIIDISHIIFNTFLGEETSLVSQTMGGIFGELLSVIGNIIIQFSAIAAASLLPIIGPLKQIAVVGVFLGTFLPTFFVYILQILVGVILILTLFPLLIVFVIRVFIIQILAVLSPLAFLCLILPQTKQYWDMWLKHFLNWTILGVAVFFLLAIGLRAFDQMMPGANNEGQTAQMIHHQEITYNQITLSNNQNNINDQIMLLGNQDNTNNQIMFSNQIEDTNIQAVTSPANNEEGSIINDFFSGFVSWNEIGDIIASYFFLAIYLLIVLAVSKKLSPISVDAIMAQTKAFGKMALAGAGVVGSSFVGHVAKVTNKAKDELEADDARISDINSGNITAENKGKLLKEGERKLKIKWTRATDKLFHLAGTTTEEKGHKVNEDLIKKMTSMDNIKESESFFNTQRSSLFNKEQKEMMTMRYYGEMAKTGKLNSLSKKGQEEAKKSQEWAHINEISRYQQDANYISSSTGEISEQALIHKNAFGKQGEEKEISIKNTKDNLNKLKEDITKVMGDDLEVEINIRTKNKLEDLGLKEGMPNYQNTKNEIVKREKANMLSSIMVNKNASVEEIIKRNNIDSFAVRVGMAYNKNPRVYQKAFEKFSPSQFNGILNNPGGLNNLLLKKDYKEMQTINAIVRNPAYQDMGINRNLAQEKYNTWKKEKEQE